MLAMNIDLALQREELEDRQATRLAKVVPAKERWQFGL